MPSISRCVILILKVNNLAWLCAFEFWVRPSGNVKFLIKGIDERQLTFSPNVRSERVTFICPFAEGNLSICLCRRYVMSRTLANVNRNTRHWKSHFETLKGRNLSCQHQNMPACCAFQKMYNTLWVAYFSDVMKTKHVLHELNCSKCVEFLKRGWWGGCMKFQYPLLLKWIITFNSFTVWTIRCGNDTHSTSYFVPVGFTEATVSLQAGGLGFTSQGIQTTDRRQKVAREAILSVMKKQYSMFTKNLLIWYNVTYSETIALRKMSGPRTVV